MRKDLSAGVWTTELVTHYTGIGTEIRESFSSYIGEVMEMKVVVNMPNGLGRYGVEDAAQMSDAPR